MAYLAKPIKHIVFQGSIWKRHDPEHQLAVANLLAATGDARLGCSISRTVVLQFRLNAQNLTGFNKRAHVGAGNICQEWHLLKLETGGMYA